MKKSRNLLPMLWFLFGILHTAKLYAQEAPSLIEYQLASEAISDRSVSKSSAEHRVRFNHTLLSHKQENLQISLPDNRSYFFNKEKATIDKKGMRTWIGKLKDTKENFRVILSASLSGAVFGRIRTPEGDYQVNTIGNQTTLLDLRNPELKSMGYRDDTRVPHQQPSKKHSNHEASEVSQNTSMENNQSTQIDVMLLYSSEFSSAYGNNVSVKLNNFLALANQAMEDSGISAYYNLINPTANTAYPLSLNLSPNLPESPR